MSTAQSTSTKYKPVPPDEHCNGKTKGRKGGLCQREAGWGTDHVGIGRCKFHGGCSPQSEKAAARIIVAREWAAFGEPIDVTPAEAIEALIRSEAQNVAWLSDVVVRLRTENDYDPVSDLGSGMCSGLLEWDVGKDQTKWRKPAVWVEMLERSRERLFSWSATALKLGLDERRVRVAEAEAAMLVQVVRRLVDHPQLGLTPKQRTVAIPLVASIMRELDAGEEVPRDAG